MAGSTIKKCHCPLLGSSYHKGTPVQNMGEAWSVDNLLKKLDTRPQKKERCSDLFLWHLMLAALGPGHRGSSNVKWLPVSIYSLVCRRVIVQIPTLYSLSSTKSKRRKIFSCDHVEQQVKLLSQQQSVNVIDDIGYRGVTCQ